jgi:hypothetical protein
MPGFQKYDNPQRELVAKVREFILGVDPAVTEAIKWQAPTFMYKGNIASFFPRSKKNVSLMFTGPRIGPRNPSGVALCPGRCKRESGRC